MMYSYATHKLHAIQYTNVFIKLKLCHFDRQCQQNVQRQKVGKSKLELRCG